MAQKKSYSRYFIILQENEKGYCFSTDKAPTGYTKLETKNDKCKVSFYVQNLKKDEKPYYMFLICNKKDIRKIINVGQLQVDEFGRADVSFEYPADNILDTGISSDKVCGAAVARMKNSEVVSIMDGFSTTEIPEWKQFELLQRKEDMVNNVTAEGSEKSEKTEKSVFDEYENTIKDMRLKDIPTAEDTENIVIRNNSEVQEETHKEEPKEEIKEELREEPKEVKEENNQDVVINENIESNEHRDFKECDNCDRCNWDMRDKKDKEEEKNDYPIGTVGEFFKNISKDLKEVKDVCKEIKRCKWYKVNVNKMDDMMQISNYNKYTVVYYPMANYYPYICNHGHYLIGYKCDEKGKMKYLIYAIPGTKSPMDQPYGGKSGFVTWIPQENSKDGMGYWLMFYDFRTSTILIPVK